MSDMNIDESNLDDDALEAEYDFANGVRGKHYQASRKGHTVHIHREDGSTEERHFQLEDGAIMLDPDVRAYFPDDESVNRALRMLIRLIPNERIEPVPE